MEDAAGIHAAIINYVFLYGPNTAAGQLQQRGTALPRPTPTPGWERPRRSRGGFASLTGPVRGGQRGTGQESFHAAAPQRQGRAGGWGGPRCAAGPQFAKHHPELPQQRPCSSRPPPGVPRPELAAGRPRSSCPQQRWRLSQPGAPRPNQRRLPAAQQLLALNQDGRLPAPRGLAERADAGAAASKEAGAAGASRRAARAAGRPEEGAGRLLTTWRPLAAPREEEAEGAAAAGGGRSPAPRGPAPARSRGHTPGGRLAPCPAPCPSSGGKVGPGPAGAAPRGRTEGPGAVTGRGGEAGEGARGARGCCGLRVSGAGPRGKGRVLPGGGPAAVPAAPSRSGLWASPTQIPRPGGEAAGWGHSAVSEPASLHPADECCCELSKPK